MNRIIKMEEQEYPLSSPDYDHAFFNHCLTTFYDQDSDDIIQAKCSAQDVYYFLQHTVDICDTPLNEIMQLVTDNASFKGVDCELVKRKIIRQKNLLKRNRAKNRKVMAKEKKQIIDLAVIASCEKEDEYKKQRNRISAQISRDKKKEKVKALEELNEQLQRECDRQKMQNEQLRQEMARNNQRDMKNGELIKSKFTRLLILLGIIFLFGLIKDVFNSSSAEPLTKNNENKLASFDIKNDPFYAHDSTETKSQIMNSIEESLTEVVENKGIVARIRQKLAGHLRNWTDQPWGLTTKAKEELRGIRRSVMM